MAAAGGIAPGSGETGIISLHQVRSVHAGPGATARCGVDCAEAGATSVLVVTSPQVSHLCDPLARSLRDQGIGCAVWSGIEAEPTRADLAHAIEAVRSNRADFIIGFGGGSAMDVAKLAAALADGRQHFDAVVGTDLLAGRALPLACIPTTAGTGSEATPIAILEDEAAQLKKGVVSRHLVPDLAYLDPALTVSMPAAVTAATGLDALTHCIEAYANRFSHPMVDSWALEGIRLIAANLETACARPDDLAAREAMLRASHLGGLCLGPVNTAAVHALAYPLGGEFHVAHGVANSLLLPHVLRFNVEAAPERYAEIAVALGVPRTEDASATALAGIVAIERLSGAIGIERRLSAFGISSNALPGMAAAAMTVRRLLVRNPREVTEADALRIYEAAL